MDAESVKDIVWEDTFLRLKLKCVPNTEETYVFRVPEGYSFVKTECIGGTSKVVGENEGILKIAFMSEQKEAELKLEFLAK